MRDRQKFQRDTQRDVLRNRATTEAAARTRSTQPASSEAARRSTQPPASSGPVDHTKSRPVPAAPQMVTPSRIPEEEKSAVTAEAKEQVIFGRSVGGVCFTIGRGEGGMSWSGFL
eukprot:sb/3476787/